MMGQQGTGDEMGKRGDAPFLWGTEVSHDAQGQI